MTTKSKTCMVCAKPSDNTICDACKAQIQGEAADKKIKIEKKVQVGSEVEKDKVVKHKK